MRSSLRPSLLAAWLLMLSLDAHAQLIRKIEPPNPNRGDPVTLTAGADISAVPETVRLYYPLARAGADRVMAAEVQLIRSSDDKPQFQFFVPDYLPFGVYDVALPINVPPAQGAPAGAEPVLKERFIGRVHVTLPAAPAVKSVSPRVIYPDDPRTMTVVGDFPGSPSEYALVLNDRVYPACGGALRAGVDCVEVTSALAGRALRFDKIPSDAKDPHAFGEQKVYIKIDKYDTLLEQSVLFPWATRTTPRTLAIWTTVLIALIVLLPFILPLLRGASGPAKMATIGRTLFVDPQTNTYSLSKIQLYLWMLAAVFGWVYLTASLSLIQGRLDFAPLPKNVPGILLVSLGTTTVAAGISSSRPKGAGRRDPSISDLVTSGDVVVPERVQYLVWTLLGVSAFLLLVLSSDPSTIRELPQVPEEFLYVMGLSSAGYLGGKMIRQPGPILTDASVAPGSIVLTLCGQNLSPTGAIAINGINLQQAWMEGMKGSILEPEPERVQYARQLQFRLPQGELQTNPEAIKLPTGSSVTAPLTIRITNSDGQAAEWPLQIGANAPVPPRPSLGSLVISPATH